MGLAPGTGSEMGTGYPSHHQTGLGWGDLGTTSPMPENSNLTKGPPFYSRGFRALALFQVCVKVLLWKEFQSQAALKEKQPLQCC